MNTCDTCIHKLYCACYGRLEALIRDFKLLAMDRDEQIECGCAANIDNLRAVLAGACVVFVREGKREMRGGHSGGLPGGERGGIRPDGGAGGVG